MRERKYHLNYNVLRGSVSAEGGLDDAEYQLAGIQLWAVGWQPHDPKSNRNAERAQEGLHVSRCVNGSVVKDKGIACRSEENVTQMGQRTASEIPIAGYLENEEQNVELCSAHLLNKLEVEWLRRNPNHQ